MRSAFAFIAAIFILLAGQLPAQNLMVSPYVFPSCGFAMSPTSYINCTGTPDCAASRCTVPAGCSGQAVMCFGESFRFVLASALTIGQSYTITMAASTGQLNVSNIIPGNHTFNVIGLTSAPTNCGAANYGSVCSTPGSTLLLSGTVNTIGWVNFTNTFVATSALRHIVIGNCDGTGNGGNLFCNISLQTAIATPVELVDFSAEPHECEVALSWETGNATSGMDRFELIRSVEGHADVVVGTVPATNGARTYHLTDLSPALSANYQLRMLDQNGMESRSHVLNVGSDCHGAGNAFESNPVTTGTAVLRHQTTGQPMHLEIHDVSGRKVHAQEIPAGYPGWSSLRIDVSNFQPGVYFVSTSDAQVTKLYVMR